MLTQRNLLMLVEEFVLEFVIVLPYLGSISSFIKSRLTTRIGKRLRFCKLRFIFQTLQSNFAYKFKCGSCTASYYRKTCRHAKVHVSEHQGVSPRTGK